MWLSIAKLITYKQQTYWMQISIGRFPPDLCLDDKGCPESKVGTDSLTLAWTALEQANGLDLDKAE